MSSIENARSILKETNWFGDVSESFRNSLAAKMKLVEVQDVHVFATEGMPMENMIIIEQGILVRSKLSGLVDDDLPMMTIDFSSEAAVEASVQLDEVEGRGRTTGLLHCVVESDSLAYATIRSKGPAKVWIISAQEIREVVSSNPQHSLEMICVMAKVMRMGSKSLRGLLKNGKHPGKEKGSNSVRVLCYDSTSWVLDSFKPAIEEFNKSFGKSDFTIEMDYTTDRLGLRSSTYAAGYDAVCLFVNDNADSDIIKNLSLLGVKMIAMRCAGFDRVDTKAARAHQLSVARVPAYSPYAVAEHAVTLLLSLNRQIYKASTRVRMANFTLDSGLMGMDIHGKTIGVMGTGKIGQILCNILKGFGPTILCYDVFENEDIKTTVGATYVSQEEMFARCDVIFLMMPLLPATHHTINETVLPKLKKGVLLINTARGGLIDTNALISGLESGIIGGCGLDVYENESEYFFQDWSAKTVKDRALTSLLGNSHVLLTAHQAFFTKEAVDKIVDTTLNNLAEWKKGRHGQDHPNNCIPAMEILDLPQTPSKPPKK